MCLKICGFRLVEPEAETDPDAVPETKKHTNGESGEEQDQEEKNSVQVEAAVAPETTVAETEILVRDEAYYFII